MAELDLAGLLDVRVVSVSRKEQGLFTTAASVGVLTGEEIARTGVTRIADALRYVGGVQVAQANSRSRAISIRGFNLQLANKLEVRMDGRSLYTPLYSGTFWERPDYVLADIDRIEVVRGPNATMWGANAVNGVINIYTKGSELTQGVLLDTVIGTPEVISQSARVGFVVAENLFARVYAKYDRADDTWVEGGERSADDRWEMARVGFRADYLPFDDHRLVLEGEVFTDKLGIAQSAIPSFDGGYALARWEKRRDADFSYEVQAYFDRYDRLYEGRLAEVRETVEGSGKIHYGGFSGHDIVAGVSYRYSWDDTEQIGIPYLDPANEGFAVASLFLEDEIEVRDRLSLSLGGTLEYNSLVRRWELQPSASLLWTPTDQVSVWGSVARAARTPTRADTDLRWIEESISFYSDRDFKSEDARSVAIGSRYRQSDRLSASITAFYTEYDALPTVEPVGGGVYRYRNRQSGQTGGAELSAEYRPNFWSSYRIEYSHLEKSLELDPDSAADPAASAARQGDDPRRMAMISGQFDLPSAIELSSYLRYVDELPAPEVPAYWALDVRVAWAPQPGMELSIAGRNLLDRRHPEYRIASSNRSEVSRSVQIQARFEY